MVDQAVNLRGWVDTRKNLHDTLKADEFLSKLVSRNATIPLIKKDGVSTISAAIQIFCGARYLAHGMTQKSMDYIRSLVIGELMSPVLPKTMSLNDIDANKEFLLVCKFLFNNDTVYNRGKTGIHWITEMTALFEKGTVEERSRIPTIATMTSANYEQYLLWLAYGLPKAQYMSALQLIVTSYVGAAKRGTVSDRFIEKVANGIKDDIGEEVMLDVDVIHTTYTNFGRYINSLNAEQVFARWLDDIPEHALRLRLTLEQVSGSGLTAFLIIGRSIKKYATFSWGKLNKLTDGEMSKYLDAIRIVGGNPYYGFNRDLRAAKSTNFSSIAYVAKELLIQIAGELSLKNYQGWIKKPKSPAIIKQLIDEYIARYNADLMTMLTSDDEVGEQHAILDAVASEQNINLFL